MITADWQAIAAELDAGGCARTPRLLTPADRPVLCAGFGVGSTRTAGSGELGGPARRASISRPATVSLTWTTRPSAGSASRPTSPASCSRAISCVKAGTVFAARLQDATDLDAVRADLAATVHRALEPAHLSLWLGRAER